MRIARAAGRGARALLVLRRLGPRERWWFVSAWWTLLEVGIRSRLVGPMRDREQLWRELRSVDGSAGGADEDRLVQVFDAAAATHVFAPSCLPRSIALKRFLRGRGVATRLRLGVKRSADRRLEGHAWLERNGAVVGDRPALVKGFLPLNGT